MKIGMFFIINLLVNSFYNTAIIQGAYIVMLMFFLSYQFNIQRGEILDDEVEL